ncbi:hypothetical protein [Flavobacterium piscis]|uniref:Lipoprotein n=1 Tax=Flavobacterium piscis TaxID=1114874 RepID=A0ABU1YB45_9FLAO|nr:hypothetical protein [Flavobacterium piscis]MDR7211460.1 hypothetical protein [Flavobacterium piscis]
MSPFFNFIIIILMFQSCSQISEREQPLVLEKNSQFDLERIDFQENLHKLYSKYLLIDDFRYDSVTDGKLTDDMLRYKISNLITDAYHLEVPQKDFGFVFRSPTLDSVALFAGIYFKQLSTLADTNKKPVAFYAEAEVKTEKEQRDFLATIKNKYGEPKHAFFISHEFNICSYEWVLADRTLEIQTSYGNRFSWGFGSEDGVNETYYKIDMLIMDNLQKENIYKAHLFEFPDKLLYDGKYYSYKDFQFEKLSVFRDEFLLKSTNEALVKEEHNLYSISRAENGQSDENGEDSVEEEDGDSIYDMSKPENE